MSTIILVRFNISFNGEIKGTAISVEGFDCPRKIVFISGYGQGGSYRGLLPQKSGEVWKCRIVRDTKPDNPERGALLVHLIQQPTWGWLEVGEPIFGVRKREWRCLDVPSWGSYNAPHQPAWREQQEVNAPFWAAQARNSVFNMSVHNSTDACKFFGTFGWPEDLRAGSEGYVVLVYPHGEREVAIRNLVALNGKGEFDRSWPYEATGQWREQYKSVQAECVLRVLPECRFWLDVGRVGDSRSYNPHVYGGFHQLPHTLRDEILLRLSSSLYSPEEMAVSRWQNLVETSYDGTRVLPQLWEDLAKLMAPGNVVVIRKSYLADVGYPESEDGYSPAGVIENVHHTRFTLVTGARQTPRNLWRYGKELTWLGEFYLWAGQSAYAGGINFEAETEKARLIGETREKIDKILTPLPVRGEDAALASISLQEWEKRYLNQWATLRQIAFDRWTAEVGTKVAVWQEAWDRYEAAWAEVEPLKAAIEVMYERSKSARVRLEIQEPSSPDYGDTLESLQQFIIVARQYLATADTAITAVVTERHEKEVIAVADAAATQAALEAAMSAPATPATWYLFGTNAQTLEVFGRKSGEGVECLVAGKPLLLPGSRAVVGITIWSGRGSRYRTEVTQVTGLLPIQAFGMTAYKRVAATILGIVADPGWYVTWIGYDDGRAISHVFASAEGITFLAPDGSTHQQYDWNDQERDDLAHARRARKAHQFTTDSREPVVEEKAKVVAPPASADAVANARSALADKFGRKR